MKSLPLFLSILVIALAGARAKDDALVPAAEPPPPGLPLSSGVGFWYFGQEQEYVVTGLGATAGGLPIPGIGAGAITRIENRLDQFNLKGDHWIFPWLNVHAIVGTGSGEAEASINPLLPLPVTSFVVGYDALVYGGGATVAAGGENLFTSLTFSYTWADVEFEPGAGLALNDPSGIETLVLTPKIGYYGSRGAVWVGAYYQFTEHIQTGTFTFPTIGPVNFSAAVEDKTRWTPVIGGEYFFNKHWSITGELGIGEQRTQGIFGVTFRF